MEIEKKLQVEFFKTEQNNEPVRDFLKALSPDDKKSVGADIMAVEMLWPIGYPTVRKLDTDLWEVRSSISDKRICRVLFTISGKRMILLHAFIKKTQKTPKDDMELGKKRKSLVLGENKNVKEIRSSVVCDDWFICGLWGCMLCRYPRT